MAFFTWKLIPCTTGSPIPRLLASFQNTEIDGLFSTLIIFGVGSENSC